VFGTASHHSTFFSPTIASLSVGPSGLPVLHYGLSGDLIIPLQTRSASAQGTVAAGALRRQANDRPECGIIRSKSGLVALERSRSSQPQVAAAWSAASLHSAILFFRTWHGFLIWIGTPRPKISIISLSINGAISNQCDWNSSLRMPGASAGTKLPGSKVGRPWRGAFCFDNCRRTRSRYVVQEDRRDIETYRWTCPRLLEPCWRGPRPQEVVGYQEVFSWYSSLGQSPWAASGGWGAPSRPGSGTHCTQRP
jgi:hypothetical protein